MTDSPQSTAPGPWQLVEAMRAHGDNPDPRVLDAFLTIPRALFLPGVPLDQVYMDDAIILKREADGTVVSSSSQPSMMALMIDQMRLQKGHNVLEIGTGSGYNAAILQVLVEPGGLVTTIEYDPSLAEHAQDALQRARMSRVLVVEGDGAAGYAPRASYDRILATAGIWEVPRAWVKQLKPRGLIVAPIWFEGQQYSAAFQLQPDGTLYSQRNLPCGFVHLRGLAAGPVLDMRVGSGSLAISSGQLQQVDAVALQMLLNADTQDGYLGHALTASDITYSLLPFLALTLPDEDVFATYAVLSDQQPFGIEGYGFAVIAKGSACFVSTRGEGRACVFGGADTLLAVQDAISAWEAAGCPSVTRLRLRLTPAESGTPPSAPRGGRVYVRGDHYLEAWFDKR
ncbi:MAG TPA: protein-L-isoaspartate O-methyltransferase [Candidatus Limnocylindrales bacterium]|nr:protein-L-isoaspartate O-methyltransferase [Candidatus Limnocylindrales bacterium]